ncbi:MAG: hypothetical protein KF831_02825 [Acidobacteria bacterium]|nr:hypothetical protein [Acidobacteriota bacterium]
MCRNCGRTGHFADLCLDAAGMLRCDECSRIVAGSFPHKQGGISLDLSEFGVRRRNRAVHRRGRRSGVCARRTARATAVSVRPWRGTRT